MNIYVWLAISILLPVLSLVLFFFLYLRQVSSWRLPKPKGMISEPPSDLSPAEIEVFFYGKTTHRSIAAILLNLAERGYLYIINKNGDFSFGKRKPLDLGDSNTSLRLFEKILLSKIFTKESLRSHREDILMRVGRHIFSRKIAEVYLQIYHSVAQKGYFLKDPATLHRYYKNTAIFMFFIALLGFTFGIWLAPEPKFLLIFWFMMIFNSVIIYRLAPVLPTRTKKGEEELIKWLRFKRFLSAKEAIPEDSGNLALFEKYLPYAITMRAEVEWAKRFMGEPFKIPDWYASTYSSALLEDFINALYPIIGFVSYTLASSKEPTVQ